MSALAQAIGTTAIYTGPEILSNKYEDGKGIIKFASPITFLGPYNNNSSIEYGPTFLGDPDTGIPISNLATISLPSSITEIRSGYLSIPGMDIQPISTFYNCQNLHEIRLSKQLTSIGELSFSQTLITSITIPDSVTSIGKDAFWNCTSLTSITIPDSVTSIGADAFSSCISLTYITIPNSVTSIREWTFYNCYLLTSIIIPDSVTSIGEGAFSSCISLTSITIPNSVTSIREWTFGCCTSLTSIIIPDSVTSIGNSAFLDCSSLSKVTLGNSIKTIGISAFYQCSALTSISIPDSVTSIGNYAFFLCTSLTSITCEAITAPTIDASTFPGTIVVQHIYVSANSVDNYKSTQYWSEYADKITAIPV